MVKNVMLRRLPIALTIIMLMGLAPIPGNGDAPLAPPAARAMALDISIDLTKPGGARRGVVLQSQVDPRWANELIGPGENQTILKCGCLLAVFATLMDYYLSNESNPWFPVTLTNPATGQPVPTRSFNPLYVHEYLRDGPPDPEYFINWGYKSLDSTVCGILPLLWAFENPAIPTYGTDGLGNVFQVGSAGLTIDYYDERDVRAASGLSARAKNIINASLYDGRPVPVGIHVRDAQGNINGGHLQLIVGWDHLAKKYRIVDPRWSSGSLGQIPGGGSAKGYADWEKDVIALMDVKKVHSPNRHIFVNDDPAPIELLSINPDGYRTGYDPESGLSLREDTQTSYITLGPWADPLGELPPDGVGKFIGVRNPIDGTYRFVVTGTGDGEFSLDFTTVVDAHETVVETVERSISAGQTLKYELRYEGDSATSFSAVSNFTPEARAGNDMPGLVGIPLAFDGRRSFDPDGSIVSYEWDFGDGSTGMGSQLAHTYSEAGMYTVTLTVTDDGGATAQDTATVAIVDSREGVVRAPLERVSVTSIGEQANNVSGQSNPAISVDGRFVAFTSIATNLVAGDSNNLQDVFVKDRETDVTERVSVSTAGLQANGASGGPAISADGRFVAFNSSASNLVPSDFNGATDVFVRDRLEGTTERISVAVDGGSANGASTNGGITPDGRFVVFTSTASNLVPGDTNGRQDVFVRDRSTGTTERVNLTHTGQQAMTIHAYSASISDDGRFVAFLAPHTSELVENHGIGMQVYVRDRQEEATILASVSNDGEPLHDSSPYGTISPDGRYVLFASYVLPGLSVRDLQSGTTEMVGWMTWNVNYSRTPQISAGGRFIASLIDRVSWDVYFEHHPWWDTGGEITDIVVFDRETGERSLVSASSTGDVANTRSTSFGLSHDGRFVAFSSGATNLVANDTNARWDVFIRDMAAVKPVANIGGPYLGWAAADPGSWYGRIRFDGEASFDPNARSLTAYWDFGDGSDPIVTSDLTTSHSYAEPGIYTATLIVSNGVEESEPSRATVEVLPSAERMQNISPSCANPGDEVTISGVANSSYLMGRGWNFSDGPLELGRAEIHLQRNGEPPYYYPTVIYSDYVEVSLPDLAYRSTIRLPDDLEPGTYWIDRHNQTLGTRLEVPCPPASNHAPVADAGGPRYTGETGVAVVFDGSSSFDPDGDPLTYEWHFGDGETGTGATPQHVYRLPGTYLVTLIVHDGELDSLTSIDPRSFAEVTITGDPVDIPDDGVPPTTIASLAPEPNAHGWHRDDVTVTLSATDDEGGSGVKEIEYRLTGAQAGTAVEAGDEAAIEITAEGATTLTYFARDNAGNIETEQELTVRIDRTPPVVAYDGNAGTYAIDDVVNITCAASDGLSGVIEDDCADIAGPAYRFDPGVNTFSASATDRAGNTGTGLTSFTVEITYSGLCELTRQFVTQSDLGNSLCAQLSAAESADARGNQQAWSGAIAAYVNEVNAQTGKALTEEQAAILTRIADAL
jgi:PKD repeat protein